jgi:hypothetical protein
MKSEELHPLPDDVATLLRAERTTFLLPPPGIADDLAARLGPLFSAPPVSSVQSPPTQPPPVATSAITKIGALKAAAILAVGASLGSGATMALRAPPKPEVRYVEVEKIVERPVAPVPVESAPSAAPAAPTARVPAPTASTPATSDKALARERTLIETARSAVSRGDGAAALEAVRTHGSEFPQGRLVEEREALAVQALMLSGRTDEARARAIQFKKRFPNGLFLPVVEAALEK